PQYSAPRRSEAHNLGVQCRISSRPTHRCVAPHEGDVTPSGLRRPARPVRGHVIGVVLHRLAQVPGLSTLRSTARSSRGYSLGAEHYIVPDVCVLEARALHRYTD
ncbi:hypothetical protein JG687_00009676, partial [Phytophthora cactorum]